MSDLLTAIQTLSTKLIPNSTGDKRLAYTARLRDYSQRLLDQVLPPIVLEVEEDEATVADPWSDQPGIAVHQILAAAGVPTTIGEREPGIPGVLAPTPEEVLEAASDEQERELALLGFFGHIGTRTDVDYSLREQFYRINEKGVEVLKSDTEDTLTSENYWKTYLDSKA